MMKRILGLGLSLLLIAGFAASEEKETAKQNTEDASITAAVLANFGADDQLSGSTIDVDTDNGFVTLNGIVSTQAEADRAIDLAQAVDGVRQVSSNMKVDSSSKADSTNTEITEGTDQAATELTKNAEASATTTKKSTEKAGTTIEDAGITNQIKLKFASDDLVSVLKIDVDTNYGVVRLSGTVKSQAEADRAIEIANKVAGVKKVLSNLVVKSS